MIGPVKFEGVRRFLAPTKVKSGASDRRESRVPEGSGAVLEGEQTGNLRERRG